MSLFSSFSGLFSLDQVAVFLLLATRLSALALMSPPIGGAAVPAPVRMAIVLAFAACLLPTALSATPASSAGLPAGALAASGWDLGRFLVALAAEVGMGATMALGLSLAFAAYGVGARVLDTQMGYAIGQVVDPLTHRPTPVITALFAQLGLVLFFATDAYQGLLRGLVLSIEAYPPGADWPLQALLQAALVPVLHQVAGSFALGFAMVAPVVLCLLLVEMALGLMSRSLPQMNMFTMSIPVKIVVGIAALGLWTTAGAGLLLRTNRLVFDGWEAMFRHG